MQPDFIVIGSGIAGLNLALHAAEKGKVLVITKKKAIESNTNRAQGGIAAVLAKTDDFQKHIKDTLETGCYHNNKKAVEFVVERGPHVIRKLIKLGVLFSTSNDRIDLGKEGGHSERRIAHVGDLTGQELEKILVQRIKENKNVKILENTFALDLIVKNKTCYGVQVIKGNRIENLYAGIVILATGSIGQIYKYTTNSRISTGDGIAMAKRAGCKVKDLEFVQFHPTVLDKNTNPRFLLSEALRGEGAVLRNKDGEEFMKKYHKKGNLAPRDIVTLAIYKEHKNGKVYLDMTGQDPKITKARFPNIYQKLMKYGLDMTKNWIPISPAVHYSCGGVKVNMEGQTCIKNLFAVGEVTCTGVHGANRLASNSLLEALVFSEEIAKRLKTVKIRKIKIQKPSLTEEKGIRIKKEIKKIMWKYAGAIRKPEKLRKLIKKLEQLEKLLPKKQKTNTHLAEARNMITTGKLIANSALKRKESLGCHYVTH